ncbi:iojap-like protein [Octadecabacter arcticus 238]|jgi:ribosome-associated protein|uniref:Ribosomal silencing factor RsfS n=2 Tax=Octadecabacter arcticus TaxID=53946 RepID=M9RKJ9_9RHOB|nr:ribosome silencing factor [Octadecabacter arcticus]AGI70345.1 iojap-like protein [Octadecabacter arcticus 238]
MPSAGVWMAFLKEDNDLSFATQAGIPAAHGIHAMSVQAPTADSTLAAVLKSLDDDKGEDIVQIDLHGKSEMGDYMVIASGRSSRQVSAMAEKLTDRLKQSFGILCKVEGRATGDWVLIDTGDVIVHVFRPEVREFYQLEKMWQNPGVATAEHNAAEAAKRTT